MEYEKFLVGRVKHTVCFCKRFGACAMHTIISMVLLLLLMFLSRPLLYVRRGAQAIDAI